MLVQIVSVKLHSIYFRILLGVGRGWGVMHSVQILGWNNIC